MSDFDEKMGDLHMMLELIPRLVIIKTIIELELDYQLRKKKGETEDWEEEESKRRIKASDKIQSTITDNEREWVETHKDMIRDVMSNDRSPAKRETRGRKKKTEVKE